MTNAKIKEFDETLNQTHALLKDIAAELDLASQREAYTVLRAVVHALRDRLTIDESVELAAQMPLLVKGIYYDGWKPEATPKKMDKIDFLEQVGLETANVPIAEGQDVADTVRAVLLALRTYVSKGELQDVVDMMPKDLAKIVGEAI